MSQIVDGYTGKPNIYADVIGEHNISMYGSGDYVLQVGECLGYELISNNEIHVKDGMFITQGRRGYIKKGTTDICVIENGAQTVKRNDLIIIEYAKDQSSQVESHTTKVIKGIPGETAADPDVITGDIPNGAILHQMPLYRVKLEGLNIVAVEQLFEFGSVAAETVNPMLATEEGFAADAKLTGDALDKLDSNLGYGRIHFKWSEDYANNKGYLNVGIDDVQEVMRLYHGFNSLDVINRLAVLESKFSNYTPVDTLSGNFTVGGLKDGHSIDKVITFSPAFGSIPTVTVGITTQEHKYAYVSVSEITQGSCKITVRNGHSTEYYSNIGVNWSAVAQA